MVGWRAGKELRRTAHAGSEVAVHYHGSRLQHCPLAEDQVDVVETHGDRCERKSRRLSRRLDLVPRNDQLHPGLRLLYPQDMSSQIWAAGVLSTSPAQD